MRAIFSSADLQRDNECVFDEQDSLPFHPASGREALPSSFSKRGLQIAQLRPPALNRSSAEPPTPRKLFSISVVPKPRFCGSTTGGPPVSAHSMCSTRSGSPIRQGRGSLRDQTGILPAVQGSFLPCPEIAIPIKHQWRIPTFQTGDGSALRLQARKDQHRVWECCPD